MREIVGANAMITLVVMTCKVWVDQSSGLEYLIHTDTMWGQKGVQKPAKWWWLKQAYLYTAHIFTNLRVDQSTPHNIYIYTYLYMHMYVNTCYIHAHIHIYIYTFIYLFICFRRNRKTDQNQKLCLLVDDRVTWRSMPPLSGGGSRGRILWIPGASAWDWVSLFLATGK